MKCRVGLDGEHPLGALADKVVSRVGQLGDHFTATVIVGIDDPYCIRPDDVGPRVFLPLVGDARPRPVGRDLLRLSNAIVCADDRETFLVAACAPSVPLIVAQLASTGPLGPSSPVARAGVREVLHRHPDLTQRVYHPDFDEVDPIDVLALACLEAVLLCSEGGAAPAVGGTQQ
jgi:hypothetical protein